MIPSIQLINALRTVAQKIERGEITYNWGSCGDCNCGILVQNLLGIRSEEMRFGHCWTTAAMNPEVNICSSTGLEMRKVVRGLKEVGLTRKDIVELEYLRNREVAKRLGWTWERIRLRLRKGTFGWYAMAASNKGKSEAVAYFRAQADILEEQLGEQWETRPVAPTTAKQLMEVK